MTDSQLLTRVPVLPIRNTVIFPGTAVPLRVGRPKSVAAIEAVRESADGPWVLLVAQKRESDGVSPEGEAAGATSASGDAELADLFKVGTLAKVEKVRGNATEGFQLLVRGVERFKISEIHETHDAQGRPYYEGLGGVWPDVTQGVHALDAPTAAALLKSLKSLSQEILEELPADTDGISKLVDGIEDLAFLSYLCAGNLDVPHLKKQELLELPSVRERVLSLLEVMQNYKESLKLQGEIREKLSHRIGKAQRENILREQLRTIRDELGEGDENGRDDLRKKIMDAGMPEDVKKTALDELKRLESIGTSSPESHVIRNYLDLLCALPWSKAAADDPAGIDLDKARATLEGDHYGQDKIKKRILQHLAVMKLKKGARGSILLFVGPPGVGKTSLGQSIATALGRKFVRVSLGGVRDDAEIRGHRRTYIGAMPGRIIQGIKRAGENNPVFVLDEIDKLSRSFSGDPASALLEVLDPEQNVAFLDHYLDVPFDLSKVFFILTANSLETIPGPLLDRLEVIDLSGYTTAEKLHIAKDHLIPKQFKEHGLSPEQLTFSDEALLRLIGSYTREAGVRELQRKIAAACRAVSEKVLARRAEDLPVKVGVQDLEDLLGPERYLHEVAERIAPPGVVTGLAWTPQGGEILFIESSMMPGSGKLTITGQLGDVMKESAQIALSLVRSKLAQDLTSGMFNYEKQDLHLHVPAGAIPKDGPSAGVAMLTTLASLVTGRSVNPKLAMTGEITLRGAVMPVGGIKEKVIAAHRAGIEKVLLPKRNQRDLKEVPDEVKSQLQFEFVETAAEVLKVALGLDLQGSATSTPEPAPPAGAPIA